MGSVRAGRRKAPRGEKGGEGPTRGHLDGLGALFFSRETIPRARACMYYTHPTPAGTVRTTERPDHSTVENALPLRRVVPVRRRARGVDGSCAPALALRSSIERKKPGSAPSPSNTRVCGEDLLTHVSGIAQALVWSRLRHHTSKILSKVLFGRAPDQDVATNCGVDVRGSVRPATRDMSAVLRLARAANRAPHRRSLARAARPTELADPPPRARFRFRPPDPRVRDATAFEARAAYAAAAAASRHQRAALRGFRASATSRPPSPPPPLLVRKHQGLAFVHPRGRPRRSAIAASRPRHRPPRRPRLDLVRRRPSRARRLRPHHGLRSG